MSDKNNTTSTEEEVLKTGTEGTGTEGTGTEGAGTEGTGTEGTETEESGSCTGATEIKRLIAVYPILFESHQYKPGDRLPTYNSEMAEAWVAAGTAVWKTEGEKAVKAVPASAQAGLPGTAIPSSEEDLIGKVPRSGRNARSTKK